jgi:VanZ family protein
VPDISPAALDATVLAARKVVHFVTFGILALLFLIPLLRGSTDRGLRPFATALLWTFLYAVTDEIHQMYVPTREGSLRDVAIDTFGAAVALAGFRRIGRWRCR